MELEGKVAFVGGGALGIGAATARKFLAEGAKVAVADINEEKLAELEKEGAGSLLGIKANMGKGEEINRAFGEAAARFGGLDILINCAVYRSLGAIDDVKEEDVDLALSVGVKGYILSAQRAAVEMRKRGGGAIVSMSSTYAMMARPDRVVYCTVKGAVASMTRVLASSLGPDKIRVNAIAAGPILSEAVRGYVEADPAFKESLTRDLPLGRMGEVEEVADVMLFLVTPRSSYITGQNVVVDAGMTIV